jgi:Cof subfamily protein (haloacid dehalogenase superfamily)
VLASEDISIIKNLKPSLIFFDIDGTLLNTSGHYSHNLKSELIRLKKQGVKLAIASGRPAIAAQFLFDDLPLTDAGCFCTGAELYDPNNKKHLLLHELEKQDLLTLYAEVQQLGLYCEFYTNNFYSHDIELSVDHQDIRQVHSQHLRVTPKAMNGDEIIHSQNKVTKLLLGAKGVSQSENLKSLAKQFPEYEFAFAHFLARPDWLFASVINNSASKDEGFKKLLDFHKVDSERVMAFGDSHSDMTFLQNAGVGVAMGNASDEVKAVADIDTLPADEDGVAEVLKLIS